MICKGRSRGAASQLAGYLLDPKNERAEILEVRDAVSSDLRGALREWEAVGLSCTASEKPLYHAQLRAADGERLTDEQWSRCVERLEEGLGLTGQPRAVVRHAFQGGEHLHVVWSRVDVEAGRCVHMGWDNAAHHAAARDLEVELGLKRLESGYRRDLDRPNQRARDAQLQQEARLGRPAAYVQASALEAWERSEDGRGFAEGLKARGLVLARGDRRGYVVRDRSGETLSLTRLTGLKSKELKARLKDVHLPKASELAGEGVKRLSKRRAADLVRDQLALEAANRQKEAERGMEL